MELNHTSKSVKVRTLRGSKLVYVTRSRPSDADTRLLQMVAAAGFDLSAAQLERWRAKGWIPRNRRHGLGRGNGSVAEFSPEVVPWVEALASAAGRGVRPSDVLVKALMRCVSVGKADSVEAVGAEPVVRKAILEILDRLLPPSDEDPTDAVIDGAYEEVERRVAEGPAFHPHLLEDIQSELAGQPVPSRRESIADSRAALTQLIIAARFPGIVADELVLRSYADLGLLPSTSVDESRAARTGRAGFAIGPELSSHLPSAQMLRVGVGEASWTEMSTAATLALLHLSLQGWLAMLSLTNADDPVVVGMKSALGLPDSALMTASMDPSGFVAQLAALLASPNSMPLIASNVAATLLVLANDDGEVHLVHRHLATLQALTSTSE